MATPLSGTGIRSAVMLGKASRAPPATETATPDAPTPRLPRSRPAGTRPAVPVAFLRLSPPLDFKCPTRATARRSRMATHAAVPSGGRRSRLCGSRRSTRSEGRCGCCCCCHTVQWSHAVPGTSRHTHPAAFGGTKRTLPPPGAQIKGPPVRTYSRAKGAGGCGRGALARVRRLLACCRLPPAGYIAVGALLRCPLPLDLLRCCCLSHRRSHRRFPVPSLRAGCVYSLAASHPTSCGPGAQPRSRSGPCTKTFTAPVL
jgi:hypothetical protein